jgi:predicted N-acetyltransferase YhbS
MDHVHVNTQWAIRPYQEGDEDALLQLRRLCFPKDDVGSQAEHHLWLARDPFGCCECVAVSGGEVIGYQGRLLAPLQLLDRQTFAEIGFDLMVSPRYRGRGIGGALVSASRREAKQRGAEVSIGFRNACWGRVLRVDQEVLLGHLPALFCATSTWGRLSLGMWSIRYPLVKADDSILHRSEHVQVDVEALQPTTADLHDLALLDGGFGAIRIIRTIPWLDWCYLQRPEPPVRFLIVRAHGETIGYVIYSARRFHRLLSIGKIEHVAFPRAVPVATAKDALVKALLSTDDIDLWWSRAFPHSEYGRLLSAIGFSHCPGLASRVVVTIPDEHAKELVLDCSRWYLSPSDMF